MLHGKQESSHLYLSSTDGLDTLGEPVLCCYASLHTFASRRCVCSSGVPQLLSAPRNTLQITCRLDWIYILARGGVQIFAAGSQYLLIWEHTEILKTKENCS